MAKIAEVEQFRTLWAEKVAAKAEALAAFAAKDVAKGEALGFKSGVEGQKYSEARALCDSLLANHPEYFTQFEGRTHDMMVSLIDAFRAAGVEDDVTLATMYMMAKWEPLNLGGHVEATVRIPGKGSN